MIKNKNILAITLAVLMAGIFLLLLPMEAFGTTIRQFFMNYSWMDKVSHFLLFSTLTTGIYLSFNIRPNYLFVTMCIAATCAELMQVFSVRTVSGFDLLANLTGVLIAYIIVNSPWKAYGNNGIILTR